ncbi:MAG TPA: thiamine phosphate synthase [Pseudolabrys sp.]|jgi:thiamine-phosphate pyrophosphorylase|nr:thiamine phosphate synthase [Pseudolabrys sp.]
MPSRPKQPTPRPASRLYLITPQIADASAFSLQLASALEADEVAAVLLRLGGVDERTLINCAKALTTPVQAKGCALLLDGRPNLVASAGADGAHLTSIEAFKDAIGQLKPERIAGAGGLATRHDAMLAAEQGADYVMFGEPDAAGKRPPLSVIEERVGWWAEVFEIPCVGYAASLEEITPLVIAGADFVALGDFLWRDTHAISATIADAGRCLRLPEPAA